MHCTEMGGVFAAASRYISRITQRVLLAKLQDLSTWQESGFAGRCCFKGERDDGCSGTNRERMVDNILSEATHSACCGICSKVLTKDRQTETDRQIDR